MRKAFRHDTGTGSVGPVADLLRWLPVGGGDQVLPTAGAIAAARAVLRTDPAVLRIERDRRLAELQACYRRQFERLLACYQRPAATANYREVTRQ